jgi:hypothetical protein
MTARWHFGPIEGFQFWILLATSPEILVFLFFMLTDPKTIPPGRSSRVAFAVSVALLAALLIAPARTEFWAKVAVLGALAVACAARPVLASFVPSIRPAPRKVAALLASGVVAYAGALVAAGLPARAAPGTARPAAPAARLPQIVIRPSQGVDSKLDRRTAIQIAADLQTRRLRRITLWLEAGPGQGPLIVARLEVPGRPEETVELAPSRSGYRIARVRP